MTDTKIRLLLVDDHAVVREGFAALLKLQADFDVIGQAGTGIEGVQLFRDLQPDITLMDLNLPDIDGVAAIRLIRDEFPAACIAVMTTYDNDERILKAVQSGARTYMTKTVSPSEMYQTIRALANDADDVPSIPARASTRGARPALSERELAVLERMIAGDSNIAMAKNLDVSINTIKTQVRAVLSKLEARSRADAVARALDLGIVERRPGR